MDSNTPTAIHQQADTNFVDLYDSEKFSLEWSKEALDALEPLLARNARRFVLFPIKYLAIWRAYKHAVSMFWIADSIDAPNDVAEWAKTSTSTDRRVIGTLLVLLETTNKIHERFFSAISTSITSPEARCFLGFQAMIENVHREALATLASALLSCQVITEGSSAKVSAMKSFERKLAWIQQRSEDGSCLFSEKVLLFLLVQGLFSSSTTAIFKWVTENSILPCLAYTYNKISADRETHINFASLLFYHLERRPPGEYAENLVTEMVEMERSFAEELIRNIDADIPMYATLREIECVADGLLVSVGYNAVYATIEDKGDVDKKVTGRLKALYFAQEMTTAYSNTAQASDRMGYEELSFNILD